MPLKLDTRAADFPAGFEALVAAKREAESDVRAVVAEIIAAVRQQGDRALFDYCQRFDRFDPSQGGLSIDAETLGKARAACPPAQIEALEFAAARIRAFHQAQKPRDLDIRDEAGVRMGARWTALDAVGLYVPGGTASYPSSVLMNALPAKVAGVGRIAMAVPTPDGQLNPLVLAAAGIAGVDEIYRIGGAQAVAALAYGTASVRPVDKIVGPGNAYVAEAKRQVFGQVGIDMIAGPSEILVVADRDNDPAWIAADLLSQAEHDPSAQALLLCDDDAYAEQVCAAVERHLLVLPRGDIASLSWRDHGAVILLRDLAEAPALIDRLAPEHLALAIAEPEAMLAQIRHAGSVFLGRHTPEAVGDYVGGPNHVLPTGRRARFSSGLSVTDFMKRSTWLNCSADALAKLGPAAIALAEAEGLHAHALSVSLRLADPDQV